MRAPDYYQQVREDHPDLGSAVTAFLTDKSLSRAGAGALVNRAVRNDGAQILLDDRRAAEAVRVWSAEPGEDAAERVADIEQQRAQTRSDAVQLFAEGLNQIRSSRKVFLEPDTCAVVVQVDSDGSLSEAMNVDVPSYYGVPSTDGQVRFSQAAATPANSGVDFSRPMEPVAPVVEAVREVPARLLTEQARQRREPTPIRKALLEEVAALRARQGITVNPDEGPQLG